MIPDNFCHGVDPRHNAGGAWARLTVGKLSVNSILLSKFVKFGVNKRFWLYNFSFSRSLLVWKMRIEWQDEVKGVNLSRDSQFFEWDDSVKTKIYSGKTLRPANLSNEYNRMLFINFLFSSDVRKMSFAENKRKQD